MLILIINVKVLERNETNWGYLWTQWEFLDQERQKKNNHPFPDEMMSHFRCFSFKENINHSAWVIMPNLENMWSFIWICCKLIKTKKWRCFFVYLKQMKYGWYCMALVKSSVKYCFPTPSHMCSIIGMLALYNVICPFAKFSIVSLISKWQWTYNKIIIMRKFYIAFYPKVQSTSSTVFIRL